MSALRGFSMSSQAALSETKKPETLLNVPVVAGPLATHVRSVTQKAKATQKKVEFPTYRIETNER